MSKRFSFFGYLLLGFLFLAISACNDTDKSREGNGKKVYADYHGVRYTREHDGQLGRWALFADTRQSATGTKTLCYNADLILENEQREIASVAYPLVGMQSNLDPDYIEYQILSAKAANIDGFFIEWGFMEHENNVLLKAMQKVAAKYDFEIGVNWCDGWLYYDWITKVYPEVNTREAKTKHFAKSYQYLIDSVFTGKTAPIVKNHPVFYLFGPGATIEEFKSATANLNYSDSINPPVVLRRWAEWGEVVDDTYIPIRDSEEIRDWIEVGAIPTAWIPARVRPMNEEFPYWDHHAVSKDLTEFMKPFRDSVWNNESAGYTIKSGFVVPGMDNRGCAGWGRGHISHIPRNNGKTYEQMWKINLASKDELDMMFIASWSDYTEGHEIEPTVENGYRDLEMTVKYAAEFKNIEADNRGIELPLKLFQLRKEISKIEKIGLNVSDKKEQLDKVAHLISNGEYLDAKRLLKRIEAKSEEIWSGIKETNIILSDDELGITGGVDTLDYKGYNSPAITIPPEIREKLINQYYEGYITFDYKDEGFDFFSILSMTMKVPTSKFGVISRIKKDDTGVWKSAKVELYKDNIKYLENVPDYSFKGGGIIRDIKIEYHLFD